MLGKIPTNRLLSTLLATRLVKTLAAKAGFPAAVELRRGATLPAGPVILAVVGKPSGLAAEALDRLRITPQSALLDTPDARTTDVDGRVQPPRYPGPVGALVVDASGIDRVAQLADIRAALRPAVRALEPSGRVIFVAADPTTAPDAEAAAARQAVDGIMRSVGKELRSGATSNLMLTTPNTTVGELAQVLGFLLSGRSAYVDGQPFVLTTGVTGPPTDVPIVVVTGAARGIGAAIAERFAADGARVVGVDVPVAGEALSQVVNQVRGTALQLDITVPDAGERIARHVAQRYGHSARIAVLVHCAGILRDKLLVNLDEQRWAAVLEVNLAAQLRINEVLLRVGRPGGLDAGSRIIAVASTSGWAGNRGQTNYAASKAGVIGLVGDLAARLRDRGIVVNGVAPGFIETDMTASIPAFDREVFRRSSSLLQGGRPVDVAEAIAFLADPATPMNGQVLRVCGQLIVGR